MKKITILALTILASLTMFTSCNDNDDSFIAGMAMTVIQENSAEGTSFTACVFVQGTDKLSTVSINKDMMPVYGKLTETDGGWQYYEAYETVGSLTALNGSYVANSVSVKEETYQNTMTLSFGETDVPGEIVVNEFEYDYEENRIKLNIGKVGNAQLVVLYIIPIDDKIPAGTRFFDGTTEGRYMSTSETGSYEWPFNSSEITNDGYQIYPAVVNNRNRSVPVIAIAKDQGKILRKNGTALEPINGEEPQPKK